METAAFVFPKNLAELLARLNAMSSGLEELRELLGSGIKCRWERDGEDESSFRRVVLTAHERFADHTRMLTKQCNGLVLHKCDGQWRVVSMPPSGFNSEFGLKQLERDRAKYTVYDVRDGTIVTLYWYPDTGGILQPCLSSTNGYDVTNHCRVGDITYMQALLAATAKYPNVDINALDKTRSYTLGFRNERYHPLADARAPTLWLVQINDLSGGLPIPITVDIGIPLQLPITLSTNNLSKTITELSNTSIDKYLRGSQAHYGFIFRSLTGGSDYIVKSQLTRKLEVLFYDNPRKKGILTPAGHEKYFALKAFLRYNDRALFTQLFPQFKPLHKLFTKTFADLTSRVVFLLKSGKQLHVVVDETTPTDKAIDAVAAVMVQHIENTNAINIADEHSRKIIEDFILTPTYLDWYYSALML